MDENLPIQPVTEFVGGHIRLIVCLEPEPELGGCVEISGVRLSTTYPEKRVGGVYFGGQMSFDGAVDG